MKLTRFLSTSCLGLLAAAAFATPQVAGPDMNRWMVIAEDGMHSRASIAATARSAGGEVVREMRGLDAVVVRMDDATARSLKGTPGLRLERDMPRYPMAETDPYGVAMVQAGAGFSVSSTNTSTRTVCIIDSGYDIGHEDLASGVGSTSNSGSGNPFIDSCGHGTHVAGTIAALTGNNKGVSSVAPGVGLHIVKVFGDDDPSSGACGWTYASSLIDAAQDCADAGADVVSMSLGCSGRRCRSNAEQAKFDQLWAQGMLSIAAAGNDGNTQSSYPASYDSVISVAAVDSTKGIADFSQQNSQVELAGPGVGVLSTVPMGMGRSDSLTVAGAGYEAIGMDGTPDASGSGPLVDCGLGTSTCPGGGGQVCLIARGDISFSDKVLACEAGGGAAAVIYNNVSGALNGTLGGVATSIPSVGVSQADGQTLLGQLGASASVATATGGNYSYYDGTSMATPHVSAVAALVWSHDTSWTNAQIRDALASTAEDLGSQGRDNAYGWGLVRAQAALDFLQGGSSCTVTEMPEQSCSDGQDNDCDGLFDAADDDCQVSCTVTEDPEVSCTDGLDNDCDGFFDADDADCGTGGGCTLADVGESCSSDADCCSNKCRGKAGAKTCK